MSWAKLLSFYADIFTTAATQDEKPEAGGGWPDVLTCVNWIFEFGTNSRFKPA